MLTFYIVLACIRGFFKANVGQLLPRNRTLLIIFAACRALLLPLGKAPSYNFIATGTDIDGAAIVDGGFDKLREFLRGVSKRDDLEIVSIKWISYFTYVLYIFHFGGSNAFTIVQIYVAQRGSALVVCLLLVVRVIGFDIKDGS